MMIDSILRNDKGKSSFLGKIDPRIKIIVFFLMVILIVSSPGDNWILYTCFLSILLILAILGKLSIAYIFKRSLVMIPFALIMALFLPFQTRTGEFYTFLGMNISRSGLIMFYNVLIKAWLAISSMIILSSTTPFPALISGMEKFKLPGIMIDLMSFMYRYIFVLLDEAHRIENARRSRFFGGRFFSEVRVFGNIIGVLFVRSFERGERVYKSMVSRGYNGQTILLNPHTITATDIIFLISSLLVLALVKLWSLL